MRTTPRQFLVTTTALGGGLALGIPFVSGARA